MKKIITSTLATGLMLTMAHAATERVMTVKTTVHGMVCSFCAQGILAHFKNHASVSKIDVDLGRKLVILEEKKGASISDQEITETIKKAGLEAKKIERTTEAFETVKAAQ
ncbi:MAG: heavy-metal-associated domain-containing protein [Verrucomicrobia bacterium]|nr:MAG: heavy-metal-associated domain-containing protein [Verrucomicrobiota bacterium]